MKRSTVLASVILPLVLGTLLWLAPQAAVGTTVPDPGACNTNLWLQNMGSADAHLNIVFTTAGTDDTAWTTDLGATIPPKGCRYLLHSEFGGAAAGTWAGAADVGSDQPLAGVVHMLWDNETTGIKTAGTYAAVGDYARVAYLPYLAVLDGRQTRLLIQNGEAQAAEVAIHFCDRNGAESGVRTITIAASSEETLYLDQVPEASFAATNGYGAAWITGTRAVAAVATVHWSNASEAYSSASSGDTTLWVPGFFRKLAANGLWNYNAAMIQNVGDAPAAVHVELINLNGSLAHAFDDTIPVRGADAYNTYNQGTLDTATWQAMIAALGDAWQGSLKVTSTNGQPLVGMCFYWAGSTGLADNLCFNAVPAGQAASKGLAFPAVYRKLTGGTDEQWSTALVQNTAGAPGTLAVEFFQQAGGKVGDTYTVAIPANGSVRLNLTQGLELPQAALDALGTYFAGSMYITPSEGVELASVNYIFFTGAGRASAYRAFRVP